VNYKEGNLLSFRILVDETGNIVTELSGVPLDKLKDIFKGNELLLIRRILSGARPKLEGLHEYLEDHLDSTITI
jgi:hypothetical protein